MVGESAVLVKGDDEQGVLPLRRVADGFVDLIDEFLALADGRGRVEGLVRAALRVDPGELRQGARCGVRVELSEWLPRQLAIHYFSIA
jgi:hypothetical protein